MSPPPGPPPKTSSHSHSTFKTYLSSIYILTTSSFGSVVLTVPYALKTVSLSVGIPTLFFVGLLMGLSNSLLGRLVVRANRVEELEML